METKVSDFKMLPPITWSALGLRPQQKQLFLLWPGELYVAVYMTSQACWILNRRGWNQEDMNINRVEVVRIGDHGEAAEILLRSTAGLQWRELNLQ